MKGTSKILPSYNRIFRPKQREKINFCPKSDPNAVIVLNTTSLMAF